MSDQSNNTEIPSHWSDRLLLLAAITVVLLISIVALIHLNDRAYLSHVAGEWIGLAQYARMGQLYPPLYDNGFFGGTRYGPIPILIQSGLLAVVTDPIVAGKVAALAGAILLSLSVCLLLWRLDKPVGVAAIAAVAVFGTRVGYLSGLMIGADALATACQILALVVALWSCRKGRWRWLGPVCAGAICAVAFFVKASAVWAPVAIVIYYALYQRRSLIPFVTSGVVSGSSLLLTFNAISGGRMLANWMQLMFAGQPASSLFRLDMLAAAATRLVAEFYDGAAVARIALGASILAILLAVYEKRISLTQIALLMAGALTVMLFTNPGIESNHLLDVIVLAIVVAVEMLWRLATLARRRHQSVTPETVARFGLAAVVVIPAVALSVAGFRMPTDASLDTSSWRMAINPADKVLSSDASIPVLMGQRPTILSSFMLARVVTVYPAGEANLVARIEAHEFDQIISVTKIDQSWAGKPQLADTHWGPTIVDAIRRHYVYSGQFWGYAVYTPSGELVSDRAAVSQGK